MLNQGRVKHGLAGNTPHSCSRWPAFRFTSPLLHINTLDKSRDTLQGEILVTCTLCLRSPALFMRRGDLDTSIGSEVGEL